MAFSGAIQFPKTVISLAACVIIALPQLARAEGDAYPSPADVTAPVAAASPTAVPTMQSGSYPLVRSEQDWGYLVKPTNRTDRFDSLEYMPLQPNQPGWYVSIGGEIREAYESIGNNLWSRPPPQTDSLQQRYLFIGDAHLGPRLRVFLELESNFESGRIGGPRPIDVGYLDVLGGFMELPIGSIGSATSLRIGREELSLGSGRLVSPREGTNVRQSFTGIRAQGEVGAVHLDILAMKPDEDEPYVFDDAPNPAASLWGVYGSTFHRKVGVDVYYLGIHRDQYSIARGEGAETRHSFGVRFHRAFDPAVSGLDFDDEFIYQAGSFGTRPIAAWSVATATGWHFGPTKSSPRLLLKADIASGDDTKRATVGTFDPYFPSGNYFGVMATTGPGAVNFADLHPSFGATLGRVAATVDWLWYWRENVNDGLYSIPGTLIRLPLGSSARFVGQRPGIEMKWQIDRHAYVQADYGVFSAGTYISATGPAFPLIYSSMWLGYKF
jgi:hypothetical protein